MRVSAIIPTYNRRQDVLRAIECALRQSAPAEEVIVVDDGSTDGTVEAVKQRYGAQVRFFQQTNAGVSAARNKGIRESHGDWIAFLDSDDLWHPEKLERQAAAIECFEGTAGVCFTDNSYAGNPHMSYSRFEEIRFTDAPAVGVLEDTAWRILAGREPFFTSSLLIRRSLLDEIAGFDESLTLREDTDLVFRLCFKTQFCFVREVLTAIDRTPSRPLGLCKLYGTRSDVVFDCSERIYNKWLTMEEIIGGPHEKPLRGLLRDLHYASAESKMRQMRLTRAFRSLACIRAMGQDYGSIMITLASRKIKKVKRALAAKLGRSLDQSEQQRVGAA